ncbi:hypothetical protein WMO24_03535, partial [Ruthenibacterium sp. CLA-JM-H11]
PLGVASILGLCPLLKNHQLRWWVTITSKLLQTKSFQIQIKKKPRKQCLRGFVVEMRGIEPLTS